MLTKEHILWAYRLLLEREPESEAVIADKLHCGTLNNLVTEILSAAEFEQKHPGVVSRFDAWVLTEHSAGFRIWVNLADTAISWPVIKNQFEQAEQVFIKSHLKEGYTALDIGANIGFFSMLMSQIVGHKGHVVGFEAMPLLSEAARKSSSENGFDDQCTIHNVALGSAPGQALLVYAPGSPNWGGAFLSFDGSVLENHAGLEVPVAPLTRYLDGLSVDFIKIDVEGAEFTVLEPAREYVQAKRPVILSELHRAQLQRVSLVDPQTYISFFEGMGYTCHILNHDGSVGERFKGEGDFVLLNFVCLPQ